MFRKQTAAEALRNQIMNTQFIIPAFGQLSVPLVLLFALAMVVLHILFAVCIANDMGQFQKRGRPIIVLTPFLWTFAALLLGLIVMAFYWLCHYSRLTRRDP